MPDYQQGKIYKITAGDLVYIGSTCEPTLARRLAGHVKGFNRWKQGFGGCASSFQLIETSHYEITLIELCPCSCKDELTARERFHIQSMTCVNKNIPGRTKKESSKAYREANQDKIKEYRETNRDKIRENHKKYDEANHDMIIEKKRAYNEANRTKINEKANAYSEANREKILERQRANREKNNENAKAYRDANQDKIREKDRARYRAKKTVQINLEQ